MSKWSITLRWWYTQSVIIIGHPLLFLFFKDFIFLYFRERGMEGEREGEKHQCVVAPCAPPIGDLACNPGMCPDWESNRRPFGLQACAQSTELTRQSGHLLLRIGIVLFFLSVCRSGTSSLTPNDRQWPVKHLDYHSYSHCPELLWLIQKASFYANVYCSLEGQHHTGPLLWMLCIICLHYWIMCPSGLHGFTNFTIKGGKKGHC